MILPKAVIFASIFVFVSLMMSSTEARKLLMNTNKQEIPLSSSLDYSLYFAALPKGTVPFSSSSKKVHYIIDGEQLITRHLASLDRILRSVPSPGAGH